MSLKPKEKYLEEAKRELEREYARLLEELRSRKEEIVLQLRSSLDEEARRALEAARAKLKIK